MLNTNIKEYFSGNEQQKSYGVGKLSRNLGRAIGKGS